MCSQIFRSFVGNLEDHWNPVRVRGNDMNATDKKRGLRIGIINNFMPPGQQHPVTGSERQFCAVYPKFPLSPTAPKQHAGFDIPACDPFGWSKLEPVCKNDDRAPPGGAWRSFSESFVHVTRVSAMAVPPKLGSVGSMSSPGFIPPDHKITFADSTPLLQEPDALRSRASEDGFLFFKHFLPPEEVLALRTELLEVVERHGWRQPGQDALGGRINLDALNFVPDARMRDDIGVSISAYKNAQKLERLHRLPHHPKLLAFYRRFFEREVLVHPRHIARMVTGHRTMVPTPPHQDFPLIQGTAGTWTCWIPLGNCPRSMGGLSMLRGSHRQGYQPIQSSKGAGGIAVPLCPWETEWAEGDYEAGDLITFPSYTIHKALRCLDKELIRLSLDVRYQPVDEPVEEKSLLPHCDLTWEEIYAGWGSDELKYYWRKLPLQLIPWNDTYMQPARRIC